MCECVCGSMPIRASLHAHWFCLYFQEFIRCLMFELLLMAIKVLAPIAIIVSIYKYLPSMKMFDCRWWLTGICEWRQVTKRHSNKIRQVQRKIVGLIWKLLGCFSLCNFLRWISIIWSISSPLVVRCRVHHCFRLAITSEKNPQDDNWMNNYPIASIIVPSTFICSFVRSVIHTGMCLMSRMSHL